MASQPTVVARPSDAAQNLRRTLAVVFGVIAVSGIVAWYLISAQQAERQAADRLPNSVRAVIHLENFIVNLNGSQESGFLRVGIDLGTALEEKDLRADRGLPFQPRVRDAILSVLATRKSDDLLTPAGKDKLKQDLLQAIQTRLPELQVREVYFTEFLVQR